MGVSNPSGRVVESRTLAPLWSPPRRSRRKTLPCRSQRLPIPRCLAWSTCFLWELLVEIPDDLPDSGPQLVGTESEPGPEPVYGTWFVTTRSLTALSVCAV